MTQKGFMDPTDYKEFKNKKKKRKEISNVLDDWPLAKGHNKKLEIHASQSQSQSQSQSKSRGGGKKRQKDTDTTNLESSGRSTGQGGGGDKSARSNKKPKDVSEEFYADVCENRPKLSGLCEGVDVGMDVIRTASRRDPNWGYETEVKSLEQWTADYTSPNRSVNIEELERDIQDSLARDAKKKRKKEKRETEAEAEAESAAAAVVKGEPGGEEKLFVRQKRRRSTGTSSVPKLTEEEGPTSPAVVAVHVKTESIESTPGEGDSSGGGSSTKKIHWQKEEEEEEGVGTTQQKTTTIKREKKKRKKKEIPKETVSPDELGRFFSYEGSVPEDFELDGAHQYTIYQKLAEEQKEVESKLEKYGRCNKTNPVEEEKCTEEWRTKLEHVSRKYCEDFLRQPKGDNYGERQCRKGPMCVFVLMATRFPDSLENYTSEDGFVCREFLLPTQLEKWKTEKILPQERRLCLGCNRLYTCYWYYINVRRGKEPDEILQDHAYEVGKDGEYNMDYCLNYTNTQPGARWTGIARPFVKFSADTFIYSRMELKNNKNPSQSVTLKRAQEMKVHFR